jgi:hypothetical protein
MAWVNFINETRFGNNIWLITVMQTLDPSQLFFLKFTSSCSKQDTCKHFCPSVVVLRHTSIYRVNLDCAITCTRTSFMPLSSSVAPQLATSQSECSRRISCWARTDLLPIEPWLDNYDCIQSYWTGKEALFQLLELPVSIYRTLPISHSFGGPGWIPYKPGRFRRFSLELMFAAMRMQFPLSALRNPYRRSKNCLV